MALAVRIYDIIIAAQENYEIDLSTLSDDERKLYEEVREETIRLKAEGKPLPMYELPIDAYDDVYEDVDIYSDHFDDDVMREVEKLNKSNSKEKNQ